MLNILFLVFFRLHGAVLERCNWRGRRGAGERRGYSSSAVVAAAATTDAQQQQSGTSATGELGGWRDDARTADQSDADAAEVEAVARLWQAE